MIRILVASLVMFSVSVFAESEADVTMDKREALVRFEVVVDTQGIEQAILATNQSMKEVVDALDKIANNKNLTPQQSAAIAATTENINQLTMSSNRMVDALPETIAKTQATVIESSQRILSDLKMNILIVLGVVVLGLVVAIVCFYWFVIKPMQSTIMSATSNVASMASSIQVTAKSLEESSKTHSKLLQVLETND